jgi:hypothetical protein
MTLIFDFIFDCIMRLVFNYLFFKKCFQYNNKFWFYFSCQVNLPELASPQRLANLKIINLPFLRIKTFDDLIFPFLKHFWSHFNIWIFTPLQIANDLTLFQRIYLTFIMSYKQRWIQILIWFLKFLTPDQLRCL